MVNPTEDATSLLTAVSSGNADARKHLFSLLYDELHGLARHAMRGENPGNILQTTALINEVYIRLVKSEEVRCRNRTHFFAVAARAMRQILISEARKRRSAKRGAGKVPLSVEILGELGHESTPAGPQSEKLDKLAAALEKMETIDGYERLCSVLDLSFFAGLSQDETAEVLGVAKITVRRDWEFAKAWLQQEMSRGE